MKSPTIYLIYDYRINKERCKKYSLYLLYIGLNLLDFNEDNLDASDYGTPRNIEKKAVDHDAQNIVVKANKYVLDKALTIKYQE